MDRNSTSSQRELSENPIKVVAEDERVGKVFIALAGNAEVPDLREGIFKARFFCALQVSLPPACFCCELNRKVPMHESPVFEQVTIWRREWDSNTAVSAIYL